jgi:hypothetical protein
MPALSSLLRGLTISNGDKARLDKYRRMSSSTPYDLVIHINSLAALSTSGWEIELGQNTKNVEPQVSTSEDSRGVIVSVLGKVAQW